MMNIDVTYITDSDMGTFESEAKLDLTRGELVDIEIVEDEDAQFIEHIYKTSISFSYKNIQYSYDVDPYENNIVNFKDTILYKIVSAELLKIELEKNLNLNNISSEYKLKI